MVFRETDASGRTVQITPVAVTITQPKPTTPTPTQTTTTRTSTGGYVPRSVKEKVPAPQPIVTPPYKEPTASGTTLSEFKTKLGVSLTPLEKTIVEAKAIQEQKAQLQAIQPTPYYKELGYRPESPAYVQAISEVSQSITEQEALREQVRGAPEGTIFYIGTSKLKPGLQELLGKSMVGREVIRRTTPRYTQAEAEAYFSSQIQELKTSQQTLEEYQRKGYGLRVTEKGYELFTPKASEVVTELYGSERPDLYTATALRTGGVGFLASGAQELLGQKGALESWKEETAQEILGFTRGAGESQADFTKRFWTSPEAITDVWLPVATLGVAKGVGIAGRALAPELSKLSGMGSRFAGVGAKITSVTQKIPEPIRYVGFRAQFAGQTALYELSKPIGQQVAKYGFYTAMEAPTLVETAQKQPELFGKRLGESLFRYEVGMGALEAGAGIVSKEIKTIRTPGFAKQSFEQRLGLRPMGTEATQPIAGLRMKGRLSEMTASDIEKSDIELARTYKEPKPRVTAEETELESLARSMDKKKPGLREFIKSEEATQPTPGLRIFGKKEKGLTADESLALGYKEPKARPMPRDETELAGLAEQMRKPKSKLQDFLFRTDEASGSLVGRKPKITTKGMTPDEALSFGYKEKTGGALASDEKELAGLADTMRKKGRLQEFLFRTDEATQPAPGVKFFSDREAKKDILKATKTDVIKKEGFDVRKPILYGKKVESPWTLKEDWMFQAKPGTLESYGVEITSKQPILESEVVTPKVRLGTAKKVKSPWEATQIKLTDTIPPGQLKLYDFRQPKTEKILPSFAKEERIPGTGINVLKFPQKEKKDVLRYFGTGNIAEKPTFHGGEIKGYSMRLQREPLKLKTVDFASIELKPLEAKPFDVTRPTLVSKKITSPWSIKEDWMLQPKKGTLDYYGIDLTGKRPVLESEVITPKSRIGMKKVTGSPWKADYLNLQQTQLGVKQELPQGSVYRYGNLFKEKGAIERLPKTEKILPSFAKEEQIPGTGITVLKFPKETVEGARKKQVYDFLFGETKTPKIKKVFGEKGVTYEDMVKRKQIKGGKPEPTVKPEPGLTQETGTGQLLILEKPKVKTEKVTMKTQKMEPLKYEAEEARLPAGLTTVERPLTSGEIKILQIAERGTGGISQYWKERPRISRAKTDGLIESSVLGETKLGGKGLLSSLGSTKLLGEGLLSFDISKIGEDTERDQDRLTDTLRGQRLTDLTDQAFREIQTQRLDQLVRPVQKQIQEQKQDYIFDYDTITKRKEIKIPRPPRKPKEEPQTERKLATSQDNIGYHVEVKERGMYQGKVTKPIKFKQITRNPLSRSDAMSLGAEVTDTGSAVSFRLKKTKNKPTKLDRPIQDYTTRSFKFTQKNDVFIEKPEYRMDTPGELTQVSALGQEARRKNVNYFGNISTKKSGSKKEIGMLFIGTPKTRSTRLLSRSTKIQPTGLFMKKKGGKNEYY